ncbi:NUDIX hydrolase [Actinomadura rudentiformis]|uniref:NUDIX hydrolase n=1 Tax=Actinomadura rudentiformis TaxID=359158 RepID=A0A6H9YWQ3_9ACTN|nr:NUDIX domain-containing protein [Actinomadura rudentiformis]KAB2348421.1 NUDIX hydrolase [Actinomadura rudentiformis]
MRHPDPPDSEKDDVRKGEDVIRAAGAVLWRDGPDGTEVALIHRPKYDDWSFPKGKLKNGEHALRAAVREVEEETGVVPRLGRRLPTSSYPKDGKTKRVDYWTARAASPTSPTSPTSADADAPFTPNDEVDRLEWLPIADAYERLSYSHDVDLLREFEAGPPDTWPLVILRHGSAGEKREWRGPDELRPLDERGRAEASLLAGLLRSFGQARLISSATARCLETLLPYARKDAVKVVTDEAFTVGATGAEQACDRLFELVDDGAPAIVCTHGEVVSDLVTGLCKRLGEKVPEDPSLRKGSFWVAHITTDGAGGPSIAALERHTPTAGRTGDGGSAASPEFVRRLLH